jgi:hypothetical protein
VADVFISFIHEEVIVASWVSRFIAEIFEPNVGVFQSSDRSTIYAGEEWMKRIFEELQSAKVLVSLLSPESVGRPWINFEAGAAWMGNVKVIPVLFAGLTITTLPKPYSSLQAVEIGNPDGCHYLAASIAHHLNKDKPQRPDFMDIKLEELPRLNRDDQKVKAAYPYCELARKVGAFGEVQRHFRDLNDTSSRK